MSSKEEVLLISAASHMDKETLLHSRLQHSLPKIGLLYIGAVLKNNGYPVSMIDFSLGDLTESSLESFFAKNKVRILAFSTVITEWPMIIQMVRWAKKHRPETIVIVGGPHSSALGEDVFKECPLVDYSVIGEGEETLVELMEAIRQGGDPSKVCGLIFQKNGEIVRTPPRALIPDLDRLPYPAWELVDLKKYNISPAAQYVSGLAANVITSRGCCYNCIFCDKTVFGNRFRGRSAANVLGEVKLLMERYGVRNIFFYDDLFTFDKKRLETFCQLILSEGVQFAWSCQSRFEPLDQPMLRLMRQAGCRQIGYGIEVASPRMQKYIKKGVNYELARKTIDLTRKTGIEAKGFFMFGFPHETQEEVEQTIRLALSLDLDIAVFGIVTPYPNTVLYEEVKDQLKFHDWTQFSPNGSFDPPYVAEGFTKEELVRIYRTAHRRFYLRPSFLGKKFMNLLRNPDLFRRYWKTLALLLETMKR